MNKKVAVALTGAATVMLAVSGCGSSTSKADDYAKVVCDAAQPQFQKMHNAENDIASVSDGNHTPDQVKSTDSAAFQQISDARKALAQAWSNAGVPPVANGAQLQQDAVKELNDTATAYANLKKTVDGLNTSDQAKFADQLKTVATQLGAVNKIPTPALNTLQSGDIGKSMANQPGCQKPTQSPTMNPTPSGGGSQGAPGGQGGASSAPSATSSPSAKATASGSATPRTGASARPSGSASVTTGTALGG